MSQSQPNPDEIFLNQMRVILKPLINSTLAEKPKDPVNLIFFDLIFNFHR